MALRTFKIFFAATAVIYIVIVAAATCYRGGKDLKVGLWGVTQVMRNASPYDNPTDPKRPIYRYAPPYAILQKPFLLSSKMTSAFEFDHMVPSVLMWYLAEIAALIVSAHVLLKLVPAPSKEQALRNLMISFLLASPLIAYELVNCQNKIIALAFLIGGINLFEKKKYLTSAVLFNIAAVVYIPLIFFLIYFAVRGKLRYLISFTAAFLAVFIIFPSVIWGFSFNNYLLKDWFDRCLAPFSFTKTLASYIEMRISSHSLPSAIGRLFVSGNAGAYRYAIPPETLHIIVRVSSYLIIGLSALAVWIRRNSGQKALQYCLLLTLPLLLPSYCLWYTWAWAFVIYYSVMNFALSADAQPRQKKLMAAATIILLLGSYSSAIKQCNQASVLFWSTLIFWAITFLTLFHTRCGKGCGKR
jgi:hypothetical protein